MASYSGNRGFDSGSRRKVVNIGNISIKLLRRPSLLGEEAGEPWHARDHSEVLPFLISHAKFFFIFLRY